MGSNLSPAVRTRNARVSKPESSASIVESTDREPASVVAVPGLIHPTAAARGEQSRVPAEHTRMDLLRRRLMPSNPDRVADRPEGPVIAEGATDCHQVPAAAHSNIVRRMRVKEAVPGEAVVTPHRNKRWMINQGMALVGYPAWHMTIFPVNQDAWKDAYELPASGKRGVTDFMHFREFHMTSPEGKHFFYTEHLVPLAASEEVGKSEKWSDPEWSTANAVVTWWFRQGDPTAYHWLQTYVRERPAQEQADRLQAQAAQANQEALWSLYNSFAKARVGRFAQGAPDYDTWVGTIAQTFPGDPTGQSQQIEAWERQQVTL